MYMTKNKSTSVITVKKFFQKEVILKDIQTDQKNLIISLTTPFLEAIRKQYKFFPNVMKNILTKGPSRDMRKTNMTQQELSISAHPVENHFKQ